MKQLRIISFSLALFAVCQPASAQFNNKPFQFKNAPNGIGMSYGGKQAIINEKIFDYRPDNMLRDNGGNLLSVEKTKGGSALVRYNGTNDIIPAYRGSSFNHDNYAMKVGVFNAFFTQDTGGSSAARSAFLYSAVDSWTGRVASEGTLAEHIYAGPGRDTVDAWTGQVLVLSGY
jgi:hypothetical protein